MLSRIITTTLLLLAAIATPAFSQAKWTDNVSAAMKQAKADNKDLLLNFTGSDWCHWCHVLEKEVFATKEFKAEAPKHFVLVTLDFPAMDADKQDPRIARQNHEWRDKLHIDGFPTIVLCDSSGRTYATLGYEEGGPKPYLKQLKKFLEVRKKRDRLMEDAKKLQGLERARKLDEALSVMERSVVATSYQEEIDSVLKLAGTDEKLTARYKNYQLYGQQQQAMAEMEELMLLKDKGKVLKRLNEMEKLFVGEDEQATEFRFMRLGILLEAKLYEESLKTSREMMKSDMPEARAMAADSLVQSLIRLERYDQAIKKVEELGQKRDSFEGLTLQFYKVDAMVGAGKKKEAFDFAQSLLPDARKFAKEEGADFIIEWLQGFVESKGEGPTYLDFFDDAVEVGVSDYWIGVAVDPMPKGLRVVQVEKDAPAGQAGVEEGDVIVSINDKPMEEVDDLIEQIMMVGPKEMKVELLRDGESMQIGLTPAKRPAMDAEVELAAIPESWESDFEAACARAKKDNQELMVFFSAKWCGPCQAMLSDVFTRKKVEEALSERVCICIDVDSEGGSEVANKYKVEALPTCLFLSADKKELGRSFGFMDLDQTLKSLEQRGLGHGFEIADEDDNDKVNLREFRRYSRERLGEGMPLKEIFRKLDADKSGALSRSEFDDRMRVIEKFVDQSPLDAYPDPGTDFVAFPGGAKAVDDAKVFGALVHRYKDMMVSDSGWPTIDVGKVPKSIERPDFSSASECRTADDLAKASLILAGGDETGMGFFTAGAVLVSSDGLAITNYHVIEDIAKVKLMALDANGKAHRVIEVLAGNKERDVALIRVEGEGFHGIKIAKEAPIAGDDLVMMHHSEMRFFTYDRGYVMRYAMISKQPWMEISAEYAPGGSGCGIFNKKHELVGVVSSITMGDGPDLATEDSFGDEDSDSEPEEWDEEEPMAFGALVVKHAVPWSAIRSLWK